VGVDAVAKGASTSWYGNIVSLAESPLQEGLIYVGTDDGLVQITEDGGAHWRKIDHVAGVPDLTYVSRVEASQHDANVVYAAFDNHKTGDFKPYVLRSGDRGKTWSSIAGDLPARGSVYALVEDPKDPSSSTSARVRPLRLAERRRVVDSAQGQLPHRGRARPLVPETARRSGHRHLRPRLLGAG